MKRSDIFVTNVVHLTVSNRICWITSMKSTRTQLKSQRQHFHAKSVEKVLVGPTTFARTISFRTRLNCWLVTVVDFPQSERNNCTCTRFAHLSWTIRFIKKIKIHTGTLQMSSRCHPTRVLTRQFYCNHCNKGFTTEKAVLKHEKDHHSDNGKPFSCKLCHVKFTHSWGVTRHLKKGHCKSLTAIK